MATSSGYPDGSHPAEDGSRSPRAQTSVADEARRPEPLRLGMPRQQGLWPGHPSGPLPKLSQTSRPASASTARPGAPPSRRQPATGPGRAYSPQPPARPAAPPRPFPPASRSDRPCGPAPAGPPVSQPVTPAPSAAPSVPVHRFKRQVLPRGRTAAHRKPRNLFPVAAGAGALLMLAAAAALGTVLAGNRAPQAETLSRGPVAFGGDATVSGCSALGEACPAGSILAHSAVLPRRSSSSRPSPSAPPLGMRSASSPRPVVITAAPSGAAPSTSPSSSPAPTTTAPAGPAE